MRAIEPPEDVQQFVKATLLKHGVPKGSAQLRLEYSTSLRLAAGLPCMPGTVLLVRERMVDLQRESKP